MSRIEERIRSIGITLPDTSAPPDESTDDIYGYGAHILRYYQAGDILFLSGQLPTDGSAEPYKGRFGLDLAAAQGYQAARLCAINALADMKRALGDLDRVLTSSGWCATSTRPRSSLNIQRSLTALPTCSSRCLANGDATRALR